MPRVAHMVAPCAGETPRFEGAIRLNTPSPIGGPTRVSHRPLRCWPDRASPSLFDAGSRDFRSSGDSHVKRHPVHGPQEDAYARPMPPMRPPRVPPPEEPLLPVRIRCVCADARLRLVPQDEATPISGVLAPVPRTRPVPSGVAFDRVDSVLRPQRGGFLEWTLGAAHTMARAEASPRPRRTCR